MSKKVLMISEYKIVQTGPNDVKQVLDKQYINCNQIKICGTNISFKWDNNLVVVDTNEIELYIEMITYP